MSLGIKKERKGKLNMKFTIVKIDWADAFVINPNPYCYAVVLNSATVKKGDMVSAHAYPRTLDSLNRPVKEVVGHIEFPTVNALLDVIDAYPCTIVSPKQKLRAMALARVKAKEEAAYLKNRDRLITILSKLGFLYKDKYNTVFKFSFNNKYNQHCYLELWLFHSNDINIITNFNYDGEIVPTCYGIEERFKFNNELNFIDVCKKLNDFFRRAFNAIKKVPLDSVPMSFQEYFNREVESIFGSPSLSEDDFK